MTKILEPEFEVPHSEKLRQTQKARFSSEDFLGLSHRRSLSTVFCKHCRISYMSETGDWAFCAETGNPKPLLFGEGLTFRTPASCGAFAPEFSGSS